MFNKILQAVNNSEVSVVIFDIDGTLKDLCAEHKNALRSTLDKYNVTTLRKNLILLINKLAMLMITTGTIPTNHIKQRFLTWVFAMLSGVNVKDFKDEYFENYTRQICLFNGVCEILETLNKDKLVCFATINKQNYNLGECGIPQDKIVYTTHAFKIATYKKLLKQIGISKEQVIIIGDNIFDDILSAKILGVKSLLVNNYNSKLKRIVCKLLNSKYLK